MRINFKQQELVDEIVEDLKVHFPDVEFVDISESPEDPSDIWINVTRPADEERQIQLLNYFGDISNRVLTEYGYSILIMPVY